MTLEVSVAAPAAVARQRPPLPYFLGAVLLLITVLLSGMFAFGFLSGAGDDAATPLRERMAGRVAGLGQLGFFATSVGAWALPVRRRWLWRAWLLVYASAHLLWWSGSITGEAFLVGSYRHQTAEQIGNHWHGFWQIMVNGTFWFGVVPYLPILLSPSVWMWASGRDWNAEVAKAAPDRGLGNASFDLDLVPRR